MKGYSRWRGTLVGAVAVVGSSMLLSVPADATSVQYVLSNCNSSLGCGGGNRSGTGTVSDDGLSADHVNVTVDLASGVTWANTDLIGFAFDLIAGVGTPTLVVPPALPADWTPNTSGANFLSNTGPGAFNADGMGQKVMGNLI